MSAFISLVSHVDERPGIEVGMVGRAGMMGLHVAHGVARAPLRALVQGAGRARRLTAVDFRRQVKEGAALQRMLDLYTQASPSQFASSATCARFHQVKPRLARWLLMGHDRAQADSFHVTQDMLAHMLGVRRVGVTLAAGFLQRDGLIEYSRGEVKIQDRRGLEAAACACYAEDERSYARLLL